nr:MAG: glycoprotein G2 [Bovine nidovirus 1]
MLGLRLIGAHCLCLPKRLKMLSFRVQERYQLVMILWIFMYSFSLEVLSYQGPLVPILSQKFEPCSDRPYAIYCANNIYYKCEDKVLSLDAKNKTLVCLDNLPYLVGNGKLQSLLDFKEADLREKSVTYEHLIEVDSNNKAYGGDFSYALINMPWRGNESIYPDYWCELVNGTYRVGVFDGIIQHGCIMNYTKGEGYASRAFIPHHFVFAVMDTFKGQIKWLKNKPQLNVGDLCIGNCSLASSSGECGTNEHWSACMMRQHWRFNDLKRMQVTSFNKTILVDGAYLEVPEDGLMVNLIPGHNGTYYFKYKGRFIVKGNCMLPDLFEYYTEYNELVVGKLKNGSLIEQVYFNKSDCKFYNDNFKDVVEYDGRLFFNKNNSLYQRVGNIEFPFGRFNDSVASSGEYLVIPKKSEDYVEVIVFGSPKEKESKWLIGVVLVCFVFILLLSWFCQRRTHYA